ncbi:telomere-associated protein RIF1-like [Sitophilus oryzae]|uniref:Telomere-associated protein RIF1-like n=1 Tax=Sitophilus oryzae TaxID=7048 RepID=A0A6J2YKY0_SITOR|nr:telomere-associated protein RIF1-like [Sitophilus oryzae]
MSFIPPGGRSAKIAGLVKEMSLKHFGKDVETKSPVNVKGSYLKDSPSPSVMETASDCTGKETKTTISIDDESNSKFVLIDSEVKIKPNEMTEHQKENTEKRREDIPALYQDLSQSLSQTFDSTSDCSKSNNVVIKKERPKRTIRKTRRREKREYAVVFENLVMNIVGADESLVLSLRRGKEKKRNEKKENISKTVLKKDLKKLLRNPETTEAKVPAKRKRGRPAQAKLESPKIESDVSSCNEDVVKEERSKEVRGGLPVRQNRKRIRPVVLLLESRPGKSIPTPKLTEFYKETSEQNRLDSETSDSTLAKDNTNLETSKENLKSDKVDQKKNDLRKLVRHKSKTRESSESDDLIESSQDSSTNITVRKKSFTKNKSDNLQITLDSFISPAKNTDTSKLVLKEDGIPQEGVVNAIPEDHEAAKETVVPDPSASEDLFIHLEKSQNTEPKKRPRRKRKSSKAARTPVSQESTTEPSQEEHFKTSPKSEKEEETVPVLDTECFVELDSISIPIQSLQNDIIKRTQSQETETQGTESVGVLSENIELQLDVPKNPDLTEKDKEMAEMETASMPLDSSNDETKVANVTAIERVVEENVSVSGLDNTAVVNNQTEETLHNSSVVHNDMDTIPETEIVCHSEAEIVCNSEPETVCNPESEAVCKFEPKAVCNSVPESVCDSEPEVICNSEPGGVCNSEAAVTSEHDETNLGSPDRSIASSDTNIPSSPVTGDTPNRNSELLNNTLDISPISQKNSPENGSCDDGEIEEAQPKIVPVALKFDHEDHENDGKEKSPEKGDDAPEKIVQTHMENQDAVKADQPTTSRDNIAERSNKFLTALNGSSRLIAKRKMLKTMSPSASRIKKLMSNVMANSFEEVTTNVSQDDILTFTREVPSPLAVPRSSILKRKHSDTTDDGLSPCPKRKRVNFSDPCTTEKKIFIKDDNSHCLFTSTEDDEEDIDRQFLAVLTAGSVESLEIETESIHTEESLQINNPLILCDDRPIFADLINCDADINVIARKLTGPMFLKALLNKLRNKGINTIGDLARKSEIEISKMPFKSPGVSNVYKVLERYHAKHCKENAKVEQLNVSVVPVENEVTTVVDTAQNDLVKAVERVKCEGTSTETICTTLFPLLDQNEILTYTKSYYQLEEKSDQSESKIDQESQTAANDLEQDDPGTSETELINSEDYNPVEKLIGQLSSSEFSEEELVKIFGVVTDKMASFSPKRLLQISIETLQKITFKD